MSEQAQDVVGPMTGFTEALGLRFSQASGERLVASWEAGPHLHQPYGVVHGGAHATVVETLASLGAWLAAGGGDARVVGVANSTDFYRAVATGTLTSTATPVHQGRSQQVWVVETRDDAGRLVARGQLRLQNLGAGSPG